jgi:uncharacterized protein
MMLLQRKLQRQTAIAIATLSLPFITAPRVFASPITDADVPSTQSGFEPRTIQEQMKVAGNYLAGHGVPQDLKRAAFWYEKAAGGGDPKAQFEIGYFYQAGIGVQKDPVRAVHWYQLAAAGGVSGAKVNLGVSYLWGYGVEKNEETALALFREAAQGGSGLAACYLGDLYHSGIAVKRDDGAAEQWYEKGAKRHNAQAEYNLGTLFFVGANHTHNLSTATTLLRESAAAGYVPAMHQLGLLLVRNPQLARYPGETHSLLNDAANAGSWRSSVLLGLLARDGSGTPRDAKTAYLQFRMAMLEGGDEAEKLVKNDMESLAAELGSEKTAEMDTEAVAWREQHHTSLEFVYKPGENETIFPAYALASPEDGTHTPLLLAGSAN